MFHFLQFQKLNSFPTLHHAITNDISHLDKIITYPTLIQAHQCHGTNAYFATGPTTDTIEADILITNKPNIGLLIKHADCQATIIYDPVKHVVANVHCGWRGNVQNIYGVTVDLLKETYNCNPKDLIAAISPSLGPDHSEFINYKKELPQSFWQFQTKPNYFDLWAISRWQLTQCGLLPQNVVVAQICTYESRDFFSYRQNKTTQRNGTMVFIS